MTDVIQTHHLSASVANEDSIVNTLARHAHPKRLHRVQVRLCSGSAVNQQVLQQKILVLLGQKNIRSAVSVRPFEPGSAQNAQGMHELTLFEHPPAWKVWLAKLGLGKRATRVQTDPVSPPYRPDVPPTPPKAATIPHYNPKLHEAFRQAIAPYTVSNLGDWVVQTMVFNYRDQQAHDILAPMISAMPAAELLAYLAEQAGRNDLVPANVLTVSQHMHSQVGQTTMLVGQGDLWVDVVAQPAILLVEGNEQGEATTLPVLPPVARPAPPPPRVRFTLDSRTTTHDDLVRHINQHVKTNARLTRVELRLSDRGNPPLSEQLARAAVINLLRERGLTTVQASIKPFAHALQHADGQHTLTLFEAPGSTPWWQGMKDRFAGSHGHDRQDQARPVNLVRPDQPHQNNLANQPHRPNQPVPERKEPVFTDIRPL